MPVFHPQRLSILALGALLSGCAMQPLAVQQQTPSPPSIVAPVPTEAPVPVVRRGRYTLVEMIPTADQRDLLQQIVTISIPAALDASVGDAMRHVLQRTGYRLCESPAAVALHELPLPAAHLHLGPLPLRDVLLVLAGPAWALSVDDVTRHVCFSQRAEQTLRTPEPAAAGDAIEGA